MELPERLQEAINNFSSLPGIGEKTASRLIFYLSRKDNRLIEEFGNSLIQLANMNSCQDCGFYCDEKFCDLCQSEERKASGSLCVVENISDFLAIENSGVFKGLFHILGGVLNPLLGIGPTELHLNKLVERLERDKITKVLLALNPSVEGDATCSYLKDIIGERSDVERIGFGVPIGGSMEYLDPVTISKAIENRTVL